MQFVTSADGTRIAYDAEGSGPAVVIVNGAMTTRASGKELAAALAPHFTVYRFDRRGRADSGDTAPYAVQREIEDVGAVIAATGGPACLYGHSSGSCLVLEAAAALGPQVRAAALYEAPYQELTPGWTRYLDDLATALATGRNGEAIALFMAVAGRTPEQIEEARQSAYWPALAAVGPTLAYDHACLLGPDPRVPAALTARVAVPVLALAGTDGPPFMPGTARTLAAQLPQGQLVTLPGQDHNPRPEVLAPALIGFFTGLAKDQG
jgi:pimeloyl-ACP methyl ester carboxylesterase